MKRIIFITLIQLVLPCICFAEQIDCKITVDYNGQSVRSAAISTSADNALAKAIDKSCRTICPDTTCKTDDCVKASECLESCIKLSSLSATECFTSDNVYIEAHRESGRKRLIALRTPGDKKRPKDDMHIANWYGSKSGLLAPNRSARPLLMPSDKAKSAKRPNRPPSPSLLLKETDRRPLLFFPEQSGSRPAKKKNDSTRPSDRKKPQLLGV